MKSWLVAGLACFIAEATVESALVSRAIVYNTTLPTYANSALPASQQMAASLSPCAMGCIGTEVTRSTCNATDFTCICTNQQLNAAISACLAQNCTVVESLLVGLGLGKDIWSVPPENITKILLLFFVEELLYAFVVAVTKLSILLFYLRLFNEPWFRTFCYIMLGLTTVYGLEQMLAIALICTPISYNWTRWDGQHSGQCGNVTVMTFFNGGMNIALDFVLFVLPVTQFVNVSWTSRKKIGVSLIFLVGLL
ncbi:CFEM domain-containing protein [Colletotrichum tofieldiae]|uniref:CFEM domain-containing protein n=1 Tax=Colletotrichum tofieldiae TaxID=708197 RepID=A0A166W721_9PEZI|nr:CFEM domain-containing protein [Colletotrichum tofieldiae]